MNFGSDSHLKQQSQKPLYVEPGGIYDLTSDDDKFDKVLMLEDEEGFSSLISEYLESNYFKVIRVSNGVEGLKKIMVRDFDIILCDMLMPTLPGDKFFIAVQKVKPYLCKRFVFMTGQKGDKSIDEFIRSVHGVMLWKPFHPHELLETIKYVLKRSREG